MWIYFIDFSENLFGFQFFFVTFATIKENGNPPLTSSTLIGGGLLRLYPCEGEWHSIDKKHFK